MLKAPTPGRDQRRRWILGDCYRDPYQRLRDGYRFQRRGPIQVRGMGELVTWFLVVRK
jgi:hypothetical protein